MNLQQWVDKHYKLKAENPRLATYRLGQAFANDFREEYYHINIQDHHVAVKSRLEKDLFYVTDDKEALQMIMEWLESMPNDYFEQLNEDL